MSLRIFWPFNFHLLKILCSVEYPLFYIGLFRILVFSFLLSLYNLEIRSLSDIWVTEDFLPFRRLPFCLNDCVLCFTEASQFQEVPLIHCCSYWLCYSVQHRKWTPVPMYCRLISSFSSVWSCVIEFILRSLIDLHLSWWKVINKDIYLVYYCLRLHW